MGRRIAVRRVRTGTLLLERARVCSREEAVARGSETPRDWRANGEVVARLAAMPRLANPFRWDCVFETDRAMYRFDVSIMGDNSNGRPVRYVKPEGELKQTLDTIAQQKSVRVFLGFARFPVAQLEDPGCTTQTLVQLADAIRRANPRGSFSLEVPVDCPTNN